MPEQDFFASPFTTECFDRTPELRAQRASYVAAVYAVGASQSATVETAVNQMMFQAFQIEVAGLIREQTRTTMLDLEGISDCDEESVSALVGQTIFEDLAELHEKLPLHGLDRIAQGAAA